MNEIGRWIAHHFDFRFSGLASLGVVIAFALWKLRGDRAAISTTNCLGLAFSVFTLISATNVGAVFLLTSPPAFELLSKDSLALIGVVTVIATYSQAGEDVWRRFQSRPGRPVETPLPSENTSRSLRDGPR